MAIAYALNRSVAPEIFAHLKACDAAFVPELSSRVDLRAFSEKMKKNAVRFEAWDSDVLVGLVSAYCNDLEKRRAFINNVSVLPDYTGKGIADRLLKDLIDYAAKKGFLEIALEVAACNAPALRLYKKNGFTQGKLNGDFIVMNRKVGSSNDQETGL